MAHSVNMQSRRVCLPMLSFSTARNSSISRTGTWIAGLSLARRAPPGPAPKLLSLKIEAPRASANLVNKRRPDDTKLEAMAYIWSRFCFWPLNNHLDCDHEGIILSYISTSIADYWDTFFQLLTITLRSLKMQLTNTSSITLLEPWISHPTQLISAKSASLQILVWAMSRVGRGSSCSSQTDPAFKVQYEISSFGKYARLEKTEIQAR